MAKNTDFIKQLAIKNCPAPAVKTMSKVFSLTFLSGRILHCIVSEKCDYTVTNGIIIAVIT